MSLTYLFYCHIQIENCSTHSNSNTSPFYNTITKTGPNALCFFFKTFRYRVGFVAPVRRWIGFHIQGRVVHLITFIWMSVGRLLSSLGLSLSLSPARAGQIWSLSLCSFRFFLNSLNSALCIVIPMYYVYFFFAYS